MREHQAGLERAAERAALMAHIQAEVHATASWSGRDHLDAGVMAAIRKIPRHRFVADTLAASAYDDAPLSIGHGQTISQPFIVALMTDLAGVKSGSRVLEIGTGSGYQAAVLGELGCEVYSVERVDALAVEAKDRLERLGYSRVHVRSGDGFYGWPEHAPYDAILITAAVGEPPALLLDQLRPGGRMVAPLGEAGFGQELTVITRWVGGEYTRHRALPVSFVPFVHEEGVR